MDAYAAHSLAEALDLRAVHPAAVPVAGGTDLMVELNFGRVHPPALLDLSWVPELERWHRENGRVFIGAGVTFTRLAAELPELEALAQAARTVGSKQIRNRATIGGNLATASPAGDSLPAIAVYDGRVLVASAERGTRAVSWRDFIVGPKQTCLADDELIVGVELDPPRGRGLFAKVGPRSAMVIAVAAVCVQLDEDGRAVRIALGSAAPTVVRPAEPETFGASVVPWDDPDDPVADEAMLEFGRLAASAARPIDDPRGSAAYRRHVVEILARRALGWALADRRVA
jgi:CO/xanthine dehydrogenase FAD-binding subunit